MKRASAIVLSCLFVCLLASASVVQAGGFALYEWSNRGVGMATAGYTKAADASVVAYNPSLMTQMEGGKVLGGVTLITPQSDVYVDGNKNQTMDKTFAVPHAYYTQQVADDWWVGVGMFTRFGLGTYYEQGWESADELQYVNLQSISMTPTVAYKVNDDFSVAVGLEILKGGIQLERQVAGGIYNANTNGYAIGGNLSLQYDITDDFAAGFIYRAPMRMSTSGSASNTALGGSTETEQVITATLPSSYTLGLSYEPTEDWLVEFDALFTRWELTDQMQYEGFLNSVDYLDYKNTWRLQLGTEYWATDWAALRLGYVYDVTPTVGYEASYMLPANDRQLFSTGLGIKSGDYTFDFSFMYVMTKERTGLTIDSKSVEFKNGRTWISGLSIGYEF